MNPVYFCHTLPMKWAAIIPDTHRPYHDKKAYALMIKALRFVDPCEIVLLGDYADFYSVSRHSKDPRLEHLLQKEVDDVNSGLDELDALFPKAKKVFLEGNHEARLSSYVGNHASALFGLTDCEYLFRLNQRPRWSWIAFGKNQLYRVLGSDLCTRHRPLASNAKTSVLRAGLNLCYGDIHKIELAYAVALDGRNLVGFCPGWLGDLKQVGAFDYMVSMPQWQLGFALVGVDPSQPKMFHHQIITIKPDYSCVVWNKKIKL